MIISSPPSTNRYSISFSISPGLGFIPSTNLICTVSINRLSSLAASSINLLIYGTSLTSGLASTISIALRSLTLLFSVVLTASAILRTCSAAFLKFSAEMNMCCLIVVCSQLAQRKSWQSRQKRVHGFLCLGQNSIIVLVYQSKSISDSRSEVLHVRTDVELALFEGLQGQHVSEYNADDHEEMPNLMAMPAKVELSRLVSFGASNLEQ